MKKFLFSTLMSACFALVTAQNQPTGVFMNLYAKDMAQPNAISKNGKWAVGSAFESGEEGTSTTINASKWNLETGERIMLVEEEDPSDALCINNEGTVVGGSYLGQPAYWLESDGLWHVLPMPRGYTSGSGDVTAMAIIEGDTIMVGAVMASQMDGKIVRWINGKEDRTFKYRDYTRYAEIIGDTIKGEMTKVRGMSTDGTRYLISLDHNLLPMQGSLNLPTTFVQIGCAENYTTTVIEREFDIYDAVSFVKEASMSHNGKYVCGRIYAVPREEFNIDEVHCVSFTYDINSDKFTHYGNIGATSRYAAATCIDNEGRVYFKSVNGNDSFGKPYIYKNGEYIELERCLLAYEGITAEQIDAITEEVGGADADDLGIVWCVSGDGKTLIGCGDALRGNIWCAKLSCSPYDLTDEQINNSGDNNSNEGNNNEIYMLYTASKNPEMGSVEITLTAKAIEGFEFVRWSDGNTENPRTIILTEDTELYAYFKVAEGGTTNLETSKISSVNIYTQNSTLHIEGATSDYHILDAAGRLIYSGNATTLQLPRGIYLVAMGGEVEKIVL